MGRTSDARERLIAAFIDLVWSRSYGSVTVDAICERASVQKGSFYHFFRSKSDLGTAAFRDHWSRVDSKLAEVFSSDVSPLDRLFRFVEYSTRCAADSEKKFGRVLGCPFFNIGCEVCSVEPEILDVVQEILLGHRRYFAGALEEAMAAREIPKGDPDERAQTLLALYEGCLAQGRIHNSVEVVAGMDRAFRHVLAIPEPV